MFAERIRKSKNPALVYGPEIDRSGAWDAGVKFAEQLQAPVFLAPLADRASFPETHPQFRGMLPIAISPLSKRLHGHDLIIVIGASVFRYYPYIAGDYLPAGAELLQIVSDPADAGAAAVGDSLLGDAKLALESLIQLVPNWAPLSFCSLCGRSSHPKVAARIPDHFLRIRDQIELLRADEASVHRSVGQGRILLQRPMGDRDLLTVPVSRCCVSRFSQMGTSPS